MALVDNLLTPAGEVGDPGGHYDEARGYTVDHRERPLVDETHYITEVSGEHDEPPPPEPSYPERDLPPSPPEPDTTRTFVEQEVDSASDLARRAYLLRTETTVRREQPDYDGR